MRDMPPVAFRPLVSPGVGAVGLTIPLVSLSALLVRTFRWLTMNEPLVPYAFR